MAKFKLYAVRRGHKTGIFRNWYGIDGAEEAVEDFIKPEFKGFHDEVTAKAWLAGGNSVEKDYDALVDRLLAGDKSALREATEKAALLSGGNLPRRRLRRS